MLYLATVTIELEADDRTVANDKITEILGAAYEAGHIVRWDYTRLDNRQLLPEPAELPLTA